MKRYKISTVIQGRYSDTRPIQYSDTRLVQRYYISTQRYKIITETSQYSTNYRDTRSVQRYKVSTVQRCKVSRDTGVTLYLCTDLVPCNVPGQGQYSTEMQGQ